MTHPITTCDRCGYADPEGLRPWRAQEVVRPARHYNPQPRSRQNTGSPFGAPPAPTLRNAYATRDYSLCPSCHAAAKQEADRLLAGQKRGMAVVAILGMAGLVWIMITSFIHSDLLGRPITDAKAWIYATPAPSPYKDPLRGIPSAR